MSDKFKNGEWESGPSLPYPAEYPGIAYYDGYVYLFGGADYDNNPQDDAFRFDPSDDSFTEIADVPITDNGTGIQRTTAVVHNDLIYVVGGRTSDTTFGDGTNRIYDPSDDSWSIGEPRPNTARDYGAASDGNEIFFFGGNSGGQSRDYADAYDPETDSWRSLEPMPEAIRQVACLYHDGEIYVIGGETSNVVGYDGVHIYDIENDSWSSGTNKPTGVHAPIAHRGGQNPDLFEDRLWLFGGEDSVGEKDVIELYDPVDDSWETDMPTSPDPHEATDGVIIPTRDDQSEFDYRFWAAGGRLEPGGDTIHSESQQYLFNVEDSIKTIKSGNAAEVRTTISNEGDETGDSQNISLLANDNIVDQEENVEISPGESKVVFLYWQTDSEDVGENKLTVESEQDSENINVEVVN